MRHLAGGTVLTIALWATMVTASAAPRTISHVEVPLDGTAVSLPQMGDKGEYSVVVTGVVGCDIDGREYDAGYRADAAGRFDQPHELLIVRPKELSISESADGAHTYILGPIAAEEFAGEAVTLRLDVDKLVDEFIRTPSEIKRSLSGTLRAELLFSPPTMSPLMLALMIGVPVLLAALVVGALVDASRKAAQRPYQDVSTMRRRIGRKCKAALGDIGADEPLFEELRDRLAELERGADELARHVITFREAKLGHDDKHVEAEINRLEQEMLADLSPEALKQYESEIAGKRQTLEYLRTNAESEAGYLLRLTKVETTVDNLRLKLPRLRVQLSETGIDRAAVEEIDSELGLLRTAIDETREQVLGPQATGQGATA